jgi:hypothetical protein
VVCQCGGRTTPLQRGTEKESALLQKKGISVLQAVGGTVKSGCPADGVLHLPHRQVVQHNGWIHSKQTIVWVGGKGISAYTCKL